MTVARAPRRTPVFGTAVFCLFGPLAWALHFGAVYTMQHVACLTTELSERRIDLLLVIVTAVVLAVLVAAIVMPRPLLRLTVGRHADDDIGAFLVTTMRWLSGLSALGVFWAGTAVTVVSACAAMR